MLPGFVEDGEANVEVFAVDADVVADCAVLLLMALELGGAVDGDNEGDVDGRLSDFIPPFKPLTIQNRKNEIVRVRGRDFRVFRGFSDSIILWLRD